MEASKTKRINSRSKGKTGEIEAIGVLYEIISPVYEYADKDIPSLSRNLTQARAGGFDVAGLPGFAVEVKRASRRAAVDSWWTQALRQAGADEPLLMWRLDRQPWRFRVFSALVAGGKHTAPVVVDLGLEAFTLWLQYKIYTML